ncbi:helix-turn-helix transcriptional regulator [Chitinophaga qingshengii]|uniref:Transcriptional regulator n=1 Tax=Chitinophaga qingshengii TaxID=1569794 RepID=A0ABR7TRB0_9BACT|nr:metalloregulator ArsR/SmtB family transcription factor [Chitinophaga qingshengii]MBC9932113.1 transcriptional regulator [Chitinophaga qingshengii]
MKNILPENEKALWILKTRGPQPLTVIAEALQVTVEGARFQLLKLASDGLVEASNVSKGRGRPQQIWSLTAKGHSRFPDSHAELTVRLLNTIRDTLGTDALDTVIENSKKAGLEKYLKAVSQEHTLEDRINKLVEARDAEGYMASWEKDGDDYMLIENHCPICVAAQVCQGFCSAELESFRQIIGEEAEVKREDHLLSGARRCAYRISPKREQ